jgi:hypothetical protein
LDGDAPVYWANDIGHAMIESVSVEIGDKEIDKHTGEWLQIWSSLTTTAEKRDGFAEMTGHWEVYPPASPVGSKLIIPLRFWFCDAIGEALPLIALQAHPVRVIVNLRKFQELWWSENLPIPTPGQACPQIPPVAPTRVQLYGDYVFLDTDERRRFAAASHEYLITQLQYTPVQSIPVNVTTANVPLVFNHACKEFIWVIQQDRMRAAREWFNFSNKLEANGGEAGVVAEDQMDSAIIRLDGYERFQRRGARYFRITQPYQRHTAVPNDFIYLYSFSLRPEDEQPSGSINCSKIDDIQLGLTMTNTPQMVQYDRTVVVYATNYNVLRIVGGLGGLAFIT